MSIFQFGRNRSSGQHVSNYWFQLRRDSINVDLKHCSASVGLRDSAEGALIIRTSSKCSDHCSAFSSTFAKNLPYVALTWCARLTKLLRNVRRAHSDNWQLFQRPLPAGSDNIAQIFCLCLQLLLRNQFRHGEHTVV